MARKASHTLRRQTVSVLSLMMLGTGLHAQVTVLQPVDIKGGLIAGTIHATVVPPFPGDVTKPFDGSPFSEMALPTNDSLVVTLQFDSVRSVQKSKVYFWNDGKWWLEAADSLQDLESRGGSYILLVDGRSSSFFNWDSSNFPVAEKRCIRLRGRNAGGSGIYLGEWVLEGGVTYARFVLAPYPPRLLPGTSLALRVLLQDSQGNYVANFLPDTLIWSVANSAVASVDEYGTLSGQALGGTSVTVRNRARTLTGTAPVSVEAEFRPEKVPPMTVKVALVMQDPLLPNSMRLHEEFRWRDPWILSNDLVRHFREATDSVVNFQIVEAVWAETLFTHYYDHMIGVSEYVNLLREPNWTSLKNAAAAGQIWFDYRMFVKHYQYDLKRNSGAIDEVWVFSAPYLGMYESQLMGPNAFYWNSPPIKDGTALTKLLSVMGLNYERGVDQAFHSFGHRSESAVRYAYEQAQGKPWNPKSTDPTPWDLFTRIDKDLPGLAHVGNIHFPPNGQSDYDYGNTRVVTSYAENWYRYPYLLNQSSQVSVSTWYFTPGDPLAEGLSHLGYLRWWYGHLPRYTGVTEGVLNNWWHYILDYEAAVRLAKSTPEVGVPDREGGIPESFLLEQNYPNPFNPETSIRFTIPGQSRIRLLVYDVLGRQVRVLRDEETPAGSYVQRWDGRDEGGRNVSSGVYFCRLEGGTAMLAVRKMVLLR